MTLRVMVVLGTRPEGIKMMPLVKALRANQPAMRATVVVTGQHRAMLDQVFAAFAEKPDIDLNLMRPNQSLSAITSDVVAAMADIISSAKPDIVLVHGDTTTAMAAAISSFYARVPVGHVEAGLRSYDLDRPWPEEFNRVAIDAIATYRFAPTQSARRNLLKEYNCRAKTYVTGNTGIDALLYIARRLESGGAEARDLSQKYGYLGSDRRLILVTGHRRESFGQGFERICEGLRLIAERNDVEVLYPVHLNPKVREVVLTRLRGVQNVRLIDPVNYVEMVYLMQRATILVTDSGGIQEEGPALGRPVLVMRDITERPEALATGVVKLVGTDPTRMREEVNMLLDDAALYRQRARPVFPYGDGTAAAQICRIIADELIG